jgi:putative spermidine/putrescine transport system substrate-binding protein
MNRRSVKNLAVRSLAVVLLSVAACLAASTTWAQAPGAEGGITMGAYGGGPGDVWRRVAKTFTDETKIPARVVDWVDIQPVIRSQAANPQYNVGLGNYIDAYRLAKDGLLETFTADELPGLKNAPPSMILKTADGRIVGAPVYFQYYGIAYNKDLAKASDFESWESLADPKWRGKLALTRFIWSATYDLTLYAKLHGGDETNIAPGIPLLKGIAANAVTVYSSMAQMNGLLSRGEVAAVPYYSARFWGAAALPGVGFELPKEGGLMLPYMLVVAKGGKDRAAALAWLNYALTAEPQEMILEATGYIPFNQTVTLTDVQTKQLGMPVADLLKRLYAPDWTVIADKQQERVNMVEQLLSQLK